MTNTLSFEVKKDGFTQLQSGNYKLTVTVNPADLEGKQQELLLDFVKAAMGSIYMMAMARVDEDTGEPARPERTRFDDVLDSIREHGVEVVDARPSRHRFEDLSYAQQAGIRCNDADFVDFLRRVYSVEWGNIRRHWEGPANDAEVAAQFVRVYCGVESRAQLDVVKEAAERWKELHLDWERRWLRSYST